MKLGAIAILAALATLSSAHSPTFGRRSLEHLLLARKAASANTCTCPSASSGYGGSKGIGGTDGRGGLKVATNLPAMRHFSHKKTPVIRNPTKTSVNDGSAKAIRQLVGQGVISSATGDKLIAALKTAVNKNTHNTTLPDSVLANHKGHTVVIRQNSTADDATTRAILDIKQSIQDALNAVASAEKNLNGATKAELQACLSAIMSGGGLPAGYSCITSSGSTSSGLTSTLNTILEQFLGILPNTLLQGVFDAVMPQLTDLLPDEQTLIGSIKNSILSVIASASGGSVTALEQLEDCYTEAVKLHGNTSYLQCYTSSGAYQTLQNSMNGVLEQFVGVLPGNLIQSVQNLVAYQLGTADKSAGDRAIAEQLNNAILSVGSSLSGSTVTIFEQLEDCAQKLLIDGNEQAAKDCMTAAGGPEESALALVNSFSQQFAGYLPSSFFTDLVETSQSLLKNKNATTKAEVRAALEAAFNNAHIGPAYVTCFTQVEACVVDAILSTGDRQAKCPGPVTGCERIGEATGSVAAEPSASATPAGGRQVVAAKAQASVKATSTAAASVAVAAEAKETKSSDEPAAAKTAEPTKSEPAAEESRPTSSA